MDTRPANLTSREIEVLRLVAAGHTNAGIAKALFVERNTVERHISNIYTKIGAGNRTEAARWAIENGRNDGWS